MIYARDFFYLENWSWLRNARLELDFSTRLLPFCNFNDAVAAKLTSNALFSRNQGRESVCLLRVIESIDL